MRSAQRIISIVSGVFVFVAWIGPAAAEYSLREKQFMKKTEEYLASNVKKTNDKCGTSLRASIDWASFREEVNKQLDGKLHRSFHGYCALPPDNMWSMCSDGDAKQAIQKKVKAYVCKFGGKGKRAITLRGSTLTFWVDWDAPNNDPYIKGYLGKQL